MATEPTNKLIRVAELDTTLPVAGGPNKIEPESRILSTGYDDDTTVFAQDLNYTFDNLAQWVQYLVDSVGELKVQIIKERVSVGEIIEITGESTNPAILKGYGTWESFGAGQVLVGVGTYTDDRSESKSWVDKQEEGEYRHVQTSQELCSHKHEVNLTTGSESVPHTHSYGFGLYDESSIEKDKPASGFGAQETTFEDDTDTSTDTNHTHSVSGDTEVEGNSSPMNNIQPSLAVYRWKRTA